MTLARHPAIAAAEAFAAEVIAPQAEAWNAAGSVPRSFFADAAAAGLCGLLVPREQGGVGLDVATFADVLDVLARACMASTFALVVHNNLAATLARAGSAAQCARYLHRLLSGDAVGAFLLTEPGAGSDAQALATSALPDGAGWLLDGTKAWISNARHADVLLVFAQTASGRGAAGIAGFLVAGDVSGLSRSPGHALLGGGALGTGMFAFERCRIDADALLFPPGAGLRAALAGIDVARIAVAAMCCGMLECGLAVALEQTAGRPAFGGHIGDFQGVQWMLADCATDLAAARALTATAAAAADRGGVTTLAAAHAKKFATRVAFTRLADCMQVCGARGLARDLPLARHLECAKIAQYLDGATEIQNVVISRALRPAQ